MTWVPPVARAPESVPPHARIPVTPPSMRRLHPWSNESQPNIPMTPFEAQVPNGPEGRPLCPLPRGHFICMRQDEGCWKAKGGWQEGGARMLGKSKHG